MRIQDLAAFREALRLVRSHKGNLSEAARISKIPRSTLQNRYLRAIAEGLTEADIDAPEEPAAPEPAATDEKPRVRVRATAVHSGPELADKVLDLVRKRGYTVQQLAAASGADPGKVEEAIAALKAGSVRLMEEGGTWTLPPTPVPAYVEGALHSFAVGQDNTLTFGACGDLHAASKHERLDVIEKLYDAYAEAGVTTVFNTGNWIDGEARFNVHDLHTRGMDAQVRYLARIYPKRPGITTYAVAGDDHEGWYAAREGVDIGHYAERAFRDIGRTDWVNLGYMEAPVLLVNPYSAKDAVCSVVHPGGGSSYALSYSAQKIVESLDGGEKPAVLLFGHYHKLWYGNIRNVWCVSTGCAQDQTPFMRKKRLEAHVGGTIVKVTQDPATGAIVRCQVELLRYFNRGYYRDRWSHSGDVVQLERAP